MPRRAARDRSVFLFIHREAICYGFVSAPGCHKEHHRVGQSVGQGRTGAPEGHRDLRIADVQRRSAASPPAARRLQGAAPDDRAGRAARHVRGRHHRLGDEGLGDRARRHALHALVPAAHGHHGREARLVPLADRRGPRRRRVQRQGADPGRARRVELPVGRHALHVRSARLHRVGSDERAVAARDAERHDARHSDGVRQLDRRVARQEDAAPPLDRGAVEAGRPHPEALRLEGRSASSRRAVPSRSTS